jgi:hypothetical protein
MLYPNRALAARPTAPSLADQWRVEVEAARAGANWFNVWSEICRARWAASMIAVADDAGLDVPGDMRGWLGKLAVGYWA